MLLCVVLDYGDGASLSLPLGVFPYGGVLDYGASLSLDEFSTIYVC